MATTTATAVEADTAGSGMDTTYSSSTKDDGTGNNPDTTNEWLYAGMGIVLGCVATLLIVAIVFWRCSRRKGPGGRRLQGWEYGAKHKIERTTIPPYQSIDSLRIRTGETVGKVSVIETVNEMQEDSKAGGKKNEGYYEHADDAVNTDEKNSVADIVNAIREGNYEFAGDASATGATTIGGSNISSNDSDDQASVGVSSVESSDSLPPLSTFKMPDIVKKAGENDTVDSIDADRNISVSSVMATNQSIRSSEISLSDAESDVSTKDINDADKLSDDIVVEAEDSVSISTGTDGDEEVLSDKDADETDGLPNEHQRQKISIAESDSHLFDADKLPLPDDDFWSEDSVSETDNVGNIDARQHSTRSIESVIDLTQNRDGDSVSQPQKR